MSVKTYIGCLAHSLSTLKSSITKNRKNRVLFLCCGFLIALMAMPSLKAQEPLPQNNLLDTAPREERTRISRREALEIARKENSGRVLSVRLEKGKWRVRMDQEGNVFNVFVDANSGQVTRPSE